MKSRIVMMAAAVLALGAIDGGMYADAHHEERGRAGR